MYAMNTCVIAAANANAALMGVKLTQLEVALESDIDLHGLFALDPVQSRGPTWHTGTARQDHDWG